MQLLDQSWTLCRREFDAEDWKRGSRDQTLTKRVQMNAAGELLWEEDYYYSGRKAFIDDSLIEEQIIVHLDYVQRQLSVSYIGNDSTLSALVEAVLQGSSQEEKRIRIHDAITALLRQQP